MIDAGDNSEVQQNDTDDFQQHREFGKPLKEAREASGISVNEVAQKLLISADIIRAIDNSEADNLPALTFTQGYIRSYARILNVSADDIIKSYSLIAPDSKQIVTPTKILTKNKSADSFFVKLISSGLIVAALVILFVWLYQTDFSMDINDLKNDFKQGTSNSGINETRVTSPAKDAVDENNEFSDNTSDTEIVDVSVDSTSEENLPDQANNIADNTSVAEAEIDTAIMSSPVINDEIILTAIGESWCEIKDSAGNRLYYQLLRQNEEVKREGLAPFTVFLGNAPEVRIEVNGQIVSFDHLINNAKNVASLVIHNNAEAERASVR